MHKIRIPRPGLSSDSLPTAAAREYDDAPNEMEMTADPPAERGSWGAGAEEGGAQFGAPTGPPLAREPAEGGAAGRPSEDDGDAGAGELLLLGRDAMEVDGDGGGGSTRSASPLDDVVGERSPAADAAALLSFSGAAAAGDGGSGEARFGEGTVRSKGPRRGRARPVVD